MKYIKMFESLSNRQVEDIVDIIFYRLEEEFEGNFFPLKVFANKYEDDFSITVALGIGITSRLGGKNEKWITDYLDHIYKEKELNKHKCYITNCGMSSSEEDAFYEIHNQYWPENSRFDLSFYPLTKLPNKRKSAPDD